MPFGITNGVSAFQRVIDKLIQQNKLMKIYTYLNDIIIDGEFKEEYDQNLKTFLNAAKDANLILTKLNPLFLFKNHCTWLLHFPWCH